MRVMPPLLHITTNAAECYRRRVIAGLNLRDAAVAAQCSETAIRNIERGIGQARPSTLKKLAGVYGCEVSDLIVVAEAAESVA